jgi:hypothetical protein
MRSSASSTLCEDFGCGRSSSHELGMFRYLEVMEKTSRLSSESRERMPAAHDGRSPKSAGV